MIQELFLFLKVKGAKKAQGAQSAMVGNRNLRAYFLDKLSRGGYPGLVLRTNRG